MNRSEAINMATTAVSMDKTLPFKIRGEIIETLADAEQAAELGVAIEKAFEKEFSVNQMHSVLKGVDYCLYDKNSLLNWYERQAAK